MGKLRLEPDGLKVESFEVQDGVGRVGTVAGNAATFGETCAVMTCGNRTFDPALNTCQETCANQLGRTVCGNVECTPNCTLDC